MERPNCQILALPLIPRALMKDIDIAKKYYKENSKCVYCCIIKNEKHENKRIIVEFENYLIFAPYVCIKI